MKLISNKALREFGARYPAAVTTLDGWRRVIEKNSFSHWADLKKSFVSVDKVGEFAVFNIGGNKYRLVAFVRFDAQIIYVKAVLTHAEYDQGSWKS